jgi:hypothetical protein
MLKAVILVMWLTLSISAKFGSRQGKIEPLVLGQHWTFPKDRCVKAYCLVIHAGVISTILYTLQACIWVLSTTF